MIKIFTGDDRVKANQEIKRLLGDYEVIDCTDLTPKDLPQIFMGRTIFDTGNRHILLRDFTANSDIFPELPKYLDTKHDVILLESKLDKRTATYKEIKDKIEIKEFILPPKTDYRMGFEIYRTAKTNGGRAVEMLRKIEVYEDPIRFTGLLVSAALKEFNPKVLKELSKLDIQMKSSKIDPWFLVESFLLKISKLS